MSTPDELDLAALRAFLAERDVACPSCGYSLRGLQSPACPECNQALKLQVGLVEPRLGAFIAGVVGLAMGFGFCLIVGLWGLSQRNAPREELVPLLIGVVILGPALWAWVRFRSSIRAAPPIARALLVLADFAVPAAIVSWFFMSLAY